jgi:hypothetical protein
MIAMPSPVAVCSVVVIGRLAPGSVGFPGFLESPGGVGGEFAAQAAANSNDGIVRV